MAKRKDVEVEPNGHDKDPENLEETTTAIAKTKKPMTPHSWDNAFHSQETVNSLKPLFEAGENPIDLLMRSIIGGTGSDEYIQMVALGEEMSKCREVGDTDGEAEVRDLFAMMPSLQGKGREQYVSAIIGQFYQSQNENRESKITRFAKYGFGSPPSNQ